MYREIMMSVLTYTLALGLASAAAAQSVPQSIRVLTIEVRPGSQAQFEEFIGACKDAADQLGSTPTWFASSPGIGSMTTYSFTRPFGSYRELANQPNPLPETLPPEQVATVQQLYRDAVVASESTTYDTRPDLSRPRPDDAPAAEVAMSILLEVRPGKILQFETYAKKVREATAQVAPETFWTMYAPGVTGGSTYAVWAPMTWADLDRPVSPIAQRLMEAFGRREGEAIYARGLDAIGDTKQQLRRLRPDLSHVASE